MSVADGEGAAGPALPAARRRGRPWPISSP